MTGRIRLCCLYCDRNDFDGVAELPTDWEHIREVQSHEEACRPVERDDWTRSVFDWETHSGVCPDCQSSYG